MPRFARHPFRWATLALLLAAVAFPAAARGDLSLIPSDRTSSRGDANISSAPVEIVGLRIGFDGHYRVGHWTTVTVEYRVLRSAVGRVVVTIPDGDGTPVHYQQEVNGFGIIPGGGTASCTLLARFGRVSSPVQVEFVPKDGGPVVRFYAADEVPRAVLATQQLVLTLGNSVGVEEAAVAARHGENDPEQTIAATLPHFSDLPRDPRGYEGVSAIVLPTGESGFLNAMDLEQWTAIERWVLSGGRLVLSSAKRSESLFRAGGRLAALAPGELQGVARQRQTAGLETYAGATEPLEQAARRVRSDESGGDTGAAGLEVALWNNVIGRTDAQERATEGFRPMVIRRPYGLGLVVILACDLDLPPISEWRDRTKLTWKLIQSALGEREATGQVDRSHGQLSHVGYDDLAGQLRGALDQFEGVPLIGFFGVATIIVIYLLLIGPVDYFLLRGTIRQMEYTWLTFPAVALLCCAVAWGLAGWAKGSAVRANQLTVVDVDLATTPGQAHVVGHLWAHVYSPTSAEFDLNLEPRAGAAEKNDDVLPGLTWQGLPGNGFGGMNAVLSGDGLEAAYASFPSAPAGSPQLAGVPIAAGATKSLTASWMRLAAMELPTRLVDSPGGPPQGEVLNPLDVTLTDCRLAYDRWVYTLGDMRPGERRRIDWQLTYNDFEYRLTRRRVADSKTDLAAPYDQGSLDVERLTEMLLFHEAAGGRAYTRLWNRLQPTVDLTPLLRCGRAILFGRSSQPAATLRQGSEPLAPDESRHWTWYRIVLPVETADGGASGSDGAASP